MKNSLSFIAATILPSLLNTLALTEIWSPFLSTVRMLSFPIRMTVWGKRVVKLALLPRKIKNALVGAKPSQGFGGIGLSAGTNTPCVSVSGGVALYAIIRAAISHTASVPTEAKVMAATFTPVEVMTAPTRAITATTNALTKYFTQSLERA